MKDGWACVPFKAAMECDRLLMTFQVVTMQADYEKLKLL